MNIIHAKLGLCIDSSRVTAWQLTDYSMDEPVISLYAFVGSQKHLVIDYRFVPLTHLQEYQGEKHQSRDRARLVMSEIDSYFNLFMREPNHSQFEGHFGAEHLLTQIIESIDDSQE